MENLKKVVIKRPGKYDKLNIETNLTIPSPGEGEVLVKVLFCGVNYADVVIRMGLYESANKLVGWPITPGFEFSGKVLAVGEGCTKFEIGEDVFGVSFFGAYASHVVVPESFVYKLPKGFAHDQAAGIPAVFLTAYHALFQNIIIRKNMKILIHSAAGGVGGALVQLAKNAGLEVIGVVGTTAKIEILKQLGADYIIDKSKEDLWEKVEELCPEGFDIVCDANGFSTLKQSYNHLAPTGKLITYGHHSLLPRKGGRPNYLKLLYGVIRTPKFSPLKMSVDNKSVVAFNLSFLFKRHDLLRDAMEKMIDLFENKKINPLPISVYAFSNVKKAHQDLESGQTTGKLILSLCE